MDAKETLACMESASGEVAKGQICIQDLYQYLSFVANLPPDKQAFATDHRLSPTAADRMNDDIGEIVGNYSAMRHVCSTFESGTFEDIIEMGKNMKVYAEQRQRRIRMISRGIESLDLSDNNSVKNIRYMAGHRSEELDKGLSKAEACQKGITTFHKQTRQHLVDIQRKQAQQDYKGRSEQDYKAELSAHVQFIKDKVANQAEVYNLFSKVEPEKIWVDFVGLVPRAFGKDAECAQRINIIQSSATAGEFNMEKLCLYRELIKDSLFKVERHIDAAVKVIGKFAGIFKLFTTEIEIVRDHLKDIQDNTIPAQLLGEFIQPYGKALKRLEESAEKFILNAKVTSE